MFWWQCARGSVLVTIYLCFGISMVVVWWCFSGVVLLVVVMMLEVLVFSDRGVCWCFGGGVFCLWCFGGCVPDFAWQVWYFEHT